MTDELPNAAPPTQPGPLYTDRPPPPSALSIASLVVGIVAVATFCCFQPLSIVPGIASIVLGILALKISANQPPGGKAMAIVGIVLGSIAALLSLLVIGGIIAVIVFGQPASNTFSTVNPNPSSP
jgi:hypothetical protein